ncbi:acyltransferase [Comamonas sp. JNW]|jgi:peptidoglycan/LPS O-acetylase OafA/YrhL|nr:acyltransferase [Comamonas sp. JNW]
MQPSMPHRSNSFDILRICAALAVIFCHHYYISGREGPAWMNVGMIGGVAVMTFFTISGYLVTTSWLREPHVVKFCAKRLLRLWPGMMAAVVLNIYVFGVAFTDLPARSFLTHGQTLEYFKNLLLYRAYVNLPEVFSSNPLSNLMNGPLWTIPIETMCYAALAVAGLVGVFRYRWLASLVLVAYILLFIARYNADFTGTMMHWWEYPAYFACGALIALHRDRFLAHGAAITFGLIPVALFFWLTGLQHTSGLVVLPALLIFLGSCSSSFSGGVSRLGDPSYGVYLSGCPIAQAVFAVSPGMDFYASMGLSMLLSMLLGYALWHLIESPALRLKRYL